MNTDKRNRPGLLVALCTTFLATVFFLYCPERGLAADPGFRLTVVHVNDTHAHVAPVEMRLQLAGKNVYSDVGGFSRLATKVFDVRKGWPYSLVLHAGDVFQGTLYFSKYSGLADADLMNFIGFDAMVVGNHEFDKGSEVLARFIKEVDFPVLAANLDTSKDPVLDGLIAPYVIKNLGKDKIAILGLVAPETPYISSPDESLVFNHPFETAKKTVQMLEEKGINKIIILSHIGYEKDIKLAEAVDGIDLIVGGHSHTLLGNFDSLGMAFWKPYPTLARTPSGQTAYVVQAWEWLKVVGVLEVVFNANGIVTRCEGRPVMLSGGDFWKKDQDGKRILLDEKENTQLFSIIASNPSIEAVVENSDALRKVAFYDKELDLLNTQVVATVVNDLFHTRVPGTTHKSTGHLMSQGSHIAPLVAEAMLWKVCSSGYAVQVIVQNAGGIRADIPKGDLTSAKVYEVLPFGNSLYLLKLTGRQILDALEIGVSRGSGAFPYVAGLRYKVDMSRDKGSKIVHAEIRMPQDEWKILDDRAQYLVGTNSYLASGGDGYKIFKNAATYRYDTGLVDTEVFIEYARHIKVLHRPTEAGVTIIR